MFDQTFKHPRFSRQKKNDFPKAPQRPPGVCLQPQMGLQGASRPKQQSYAPPRRPGAAQWPPRSAGHLWSNCPSDVCVCAWQPACAAAVWRSRSENFFSWRPDIAHEIVSARLKFAVKA